MAKKNVVVMAFGRFQPPTIGHELLVKAVVDTARDNGADHVIFASRTQDAKSNPLAVETKVEYLSKMFPYANFEAASPTIRTFIEAAKYLSTQYDNMLMVAGSDRVSEYKRILDKYNGKDFRFDFIDVVSAGQRDPDAEGASGMSGTKMRQAAMDGDFKKFRSGLPRSLSDDDARGLMLQVIRGLNV